MAEVLSRLIFKEGLNKPYHDKRGIAWVNNGAYKRKVFDNAELANISNKQNA